MSHNRIDAKHIGFPDEAIMSSEDGIEENHLYADLRNMDSSMFSSIWQAEDQYLRYVDDPASIENDIIDEWLGEMIGLDPGVASTVIAFSIIGACQVTSCCGGNGHAETFPMVMAWCDEAQLDLILETAAIADVKVSGIAEPGIVIFSKNGIDRMRVFAVMLVNAWTDCALAAPSDA